MMRRVPARRFRLAVPVAVLALVLLPSVALAHAELETSTPKDGATVEGTPTEIAGTYSQNLDPDGTSLKLVDAAGTVLAEGIVDPDDVRRMFIAEIPDLAPGEYTVRSTTVSAEDDELDRATWTFIVELAPTPSPTPSPTPTTAPSATPAPSPSPTPTAPSPSPVASASPTPSADGGTTGSGSDVLLPIIAAVVIVGVIAGYLFSRRDQTPTEP